MRTENASVIWCASYSAVRCMSPQTTTPVVSLPENKKCEQLLNATVGTIASAQRTRWFMSGLKSGKVESCDTFSAASL
jgi:Putative neutral zinc metallopeptidase